MPKFSILQLASNRFRYNFPEDLIKSATHQIMARFIEDEKNFTNQLEIIQTIPILLIEEIVALIPEDWMLRKKRKGDCKHIGTRRKKILPKLMHQFIKKIYQPLHQDQE